MKGEVAYEEVVIPPPVIKLEMSVEEFALLQVCTYRSLGGISNARYEIEAAFAKIKNSLDREYLDRVVAAENSCRYYSVQSIATITKKIFKGLN